MRGPKTRGQVTSAEVQEKEKVPPNSKTWPAHGGAGPNGPQEGSISGDMQSEVARLANAELVQLRIRVIALENLVIALLAEASDRQLGLVRQMATYISPRPGFTQHPLTVHAANHMVDLVERADHFRSANSS